MEKSVLFDSWRQWRVCFVSGVKKMCWGFMRIVTCIILGIVSFLVWLWRVTCRFISRNPDLSLGAFCLLLFFVWLFTFAHMRTRAVSAEWQRDSVTYNFKHFKETHGYE